MSSYLKMGLGLGISNPVVLDIGEAYTKLGFAGESEPRAVIPTTIQQVGGPVTYIFRKDHKAVVGHYQDISLKKSITKFLERIFFKELQISSKNQRVILCESLLNPTKIRQLIAEILFHHFEVASLVFAPHHLLSCFTVATGTAMVVDCSYGETIAIPVVEGTPLLWAWHSASIGAAAIHDELMRSISDNGKVRINHNPPSVVATRLSERVLEDIKVKACFVAEYERAKMIQQGKRQAALQKESGKTLPINVALPKPTLPDMVYPLNGNTKLIIPGSARESAPEVLFEQDNERVSVPTLVLDALLHCPMVARKELAGSLLVTGGTSMLPGFRHRLLFELKELVNTEERYKNKLSSFEFRVHNPPVPANLVAWAGAAIFSSLDTFKRRLITKDYFDQHNGKLPDWCGPPFPDKMPEASSPTTKALSQTIALKPR